MDNEELFERTEVKNESCLSLCVFDWFTPAHSEHDNIETLEFSHEQRQDSDQLDIPELVSSNSSSKILHMDTRKLLNVGKAAKFRKTLKCESLEDNHTKDYDSSLIYKTKSMYLKHKTTDVEDAQQEITSFPFMETVFKATGVKFAADSPHGATSPLSFEEVHKHENKRNFIGLGFKHIEKIKLKCESQLMTGLRKLRGNSRRMLRFASQSAEERAAASAVDVAPTVLATPQSPNERKVSSCAELTKIDDIISDSVVNGVTDHVQTTPTDISQILDTTNVYSEMLQLKNEQSEGITQILKTLSSIDLHFTAIGAATSSENGTQIPVQNGVHSSEKSPSHSWSQFDFSEINKILCNEMAEFKVKRRNHSFYSTDEVEWQLENLKIININHWNPGAPNGGAVNGAVEGNEKSPRNRSPRSRSPKHRESIQMHKSVAGSFRRLSSLFLNIGELQHAESCICANINLLQHLQEERDERVILDLASSYSLLANILERMDRGAEAAIADRKALELYNLPFDKVSFKLHTY